MPSQPVRLYQGDSVKETTHILIMHEQAMRGMKLDLSIFQFVMKFDLLNNNFRRVNHDR